MSVSVRYIVHDVDAAIDFYTAALGFEVLMHPTPGFAALTRDGLTLMLNRVGAGGAGIAGGHPEPGGWSRFRVEVSDLDAEMRRLTDLGATFRGDPVDGNAGRQVLVEDPSGNVIELFQPAR